jgi:hypothetical protein
MLQRIDIHSQNTQAGLEKMFGKEKLERLKLESSLKINEIHNDGEELYFKGESFEVFGGKAYIAAAYYQQSGSETFSYCGDDNNNHPLCLSESNQYVMIYE